MLPVSPVPAISASPTPVSPAPPAVAPDKPALAVLPFVCESDVRQAMARHEKILIGPRTILTPSARDLGTEHEVFVETGGS
jgi:hypothetical protein